VGHSLGLLGKGHAVLLLEVGTEGGSIDLGKKGVI
jgi:hypothetical protein